MGPRTVAIQLRPAAQTNGPFTGLQCRADMKCVAMLARDQQILLARRQRKQMGVMHGRESTEEQMKSGILLHND